MNLFNKKLDNYFTDKLIDKIKNRIIIYDLDLLTSESKYPTGDEVVYIYINRRGEGELKNPRLIKKIYKKDSFELFFNEIFLENLIKDIEITLEMISKGL